MAVLRGQQMGTLAEYILQRKGQDDRASVSRATSSTNQVSISRCCIVRAVLNSLLLPRQVAVVNSLRKLCISVIYIRQTS